jgi:subtilisin family serine protease
LTLKAQFGARPIYRLGVIAPGVDVDTLAGDLARQPGVLQAEPNVLHANPEAKRIPIYRFGNVATDVATQWAPGAIRLAQAQALSMGAGVTVAVLDTGIDAGHPAFAGRLVPGHDFVDGDTDPSEIGDFGTGVGVYGHGTHVAGVVALTAPAAKIMPLRVLDADGQSNAWVIGEAVMHALERGAQVINMSFGTLDRTHILRTVEQLATCSVDAVDFAGAVYKDPGYNADKARCAEGSGGPRVVIAAAAGNDASDKLRTYPAAERGVYGLVPVAATAPGGRLANFSNAGNWIELAAPGDGIVSAVPGGAYATWGGTSMATPFVAGTMALVLSREPGLSPAEVAKRVEDSGRAVCGSDQLQLDAAAALGAAQAASPGCR